MLKSSQDSFAARPYYLDAEGFLRDLDVIAQIGDINSLIKQINIFMGDFIASVIDISDLSEEKQRGQFPYDLFLVEPHNIFTPTSPPVGRAFLTLCFLIWEKKSPNHKSSTNIKWPSHGIPGPLQREQSCPHTSM